MAKKKTKNSLATRDPQSLEAKTSEQSKTPNGYRAEIFKGPIPHPSILAGYDQIVPGAADRIIAMAERQENVRGSDSRQEEKL